MDVLGRLWHWIFSLPQLLSPVEKPAIICVMISAEILLLMAPLLRYLSNGWSAKRADIMDGLGLDARIAYFQMFKKDLKTPTIDNACEEFEELYVRYYGRKFFWFPGLLLATIGLFATSSVTCSALATVGYVKTPFFTVPDPAMAALAGAYLWVVNDLVSRARRLDFSSSDVLWSCLRLAVAVPMGYAFMVVGGKSGLFIPFALGAFPLSTITSMMQRLVNKALGIDASALETSDDIIKLQGINRTIVDRLSNEDITTVTQFAYCDPVQLVMRSNLRFNFVTDCMNQALAWMYMESLMAVLRPLGLRGAVEIRQLMQSLDKDGITDIEKVDHLVAKNAFTKVAAAIGIDPDLLQITFRQIGEDPYAAYLERVWNNNDALLGSR